MAGLIDTDIAIHLRDGSGWVEEQVRQLSPPLYLSAISRIELENGIHREPEWARTRSDLLDQLLTFVSTLDFGTEEIAAYRRILGATGYSKRKTADRMTAATALVHEMPLATLNGRDFRDIPGLQLIEWQHPEK